MHEEIERLHNSARCIFCGKFKPTSEFYKNTDPRAKLGITSMCKKCATDIACRKDKDGKFQGPTKGSVMEALEYLDKPFYIKLWDSTYREINNPNALKTYKDMWGGYIKNIQLGQYKGERWKNGDVYRQSAIIGKLDTNLSSELEMDEFQKHQASVEEALRETELQRQDVIKAIGYDPFENYPNDEDKPMLYASLDSFIDEDSRDDGMKMKAIIQIVKTYNQIEKINDTIDRYVNDSDSLPANTASLNKLSEVVSRLNRAAISLAKDNGISVNNNNNKSKGANTLSGKIKMLNEIGFREVEINTFDYETCEGMRQVAELSEEARHKQIGYDENIASEIKDIKVELVESLTKERDAALETMRRLLVENLDLKEALKIAGGL